MRSKKKVPIKRRRQNRAKDAPETSAGEVPAEPGAESDQIKARLLRWISLGDQALGREKRDYAVPPTRR